MTGGGVGDSAVTGTAVEAVEFGDPVRRRLGRPRLVEVESGTLVLLRGRWVRRFRWIELPGRVRDPEQPAQFAP